MYKSIVILLSVLSLVTLAESTENGRFSNEREIFFRSSDSTITLAGTITFPVNSPPVSAAVILPVAGPSDRDGTLGPHTLYKTLAHALAGNGVATLRFDTRGTGQSGGNILETDLLDRADDACEAFRALKKELGMGDIREGYIGISEGGGIGAIAASRCSRPAFLVLLSTPIGNGRDVLYDRMERLIAQSMLPEQQKSDLEKVLTRFLELASGADAATDRDEIRDILSGPYGNLILPPYRFVPQTVEGRTDFVLSPWYQSQLNYRIQENLSGTKADILSIYGTLDAVIDPQRNVELLKDLKPDATVHLKKGLNHLLQEAVTGSPAEYTTLPESMSEEVMDEIAEWLRHL